MIAQKHAYKIIVPYMRHWKLLMGRMPMLLLYVAIRLIMGDITTIF